MGKPQNKKGGKNAPGGTPKSKPNTPQMKKGGKQTPTPKSEPLKKFTKKESSSDEMDSSSNSFDDDFEALLTGPTKKTNADEKIPKLVAVKENGQKDKTPKQNDKSKQSPKAVTPAKATPAKQTPGKVVPDKKTPGKEAAGNKTPGKPTPSKETPGKAVPGKQTPGKATPGKKEAGKKTPEAKVPAAVMGSAQKKTTPATSAVKDKQQKRKRDDSSDDDEEVTFSTKLAKTSNTPEKVTPQVVSTPSKAASPVKLANDKKKSPEKKVVAVQSKKRQHDDSDDEDEVEEESQAKKLKAATGDEKETSTVNIITKDNQFKAQVNKCVLFIKNFSKDVTEKDVMTLSKDIHDVQLRTIYSKKVDNQSYAYLRFKDEKTADANYKLLANRKLAGSQIVVDYVGEKSKNRKHLTEKPLSIEEIDPLKLYIRGFGKDTVETDLRKLFPTALTVDVPRKVKDNFPIGYAFAVFKTQEECKAAHDSMQGKVVDGRVLIVLFAKKKVMPAAVLQPAKPKATAVAAVKPEKPAANKKTKPVKKEEDVEEEDDDDEEEEDDDSEDDDEDDDDDDDDSDDDEDDDDDDSNDDDDDSDDDDDDDDE